MLSFYALSSTASSNFSTWLGGWIMNLNDDMKVMIIMLRKKMQFRFSRRKSRICTKFAHLSHVRGAKLNGKYALNSTSFKG